MIPCLRHKESFKAHANKQFDHTIGLFLSVA